MRRRPPRSSARCWSGIPTTTERRTSSRQPSTRPAKGTRPVPCGRRSCKWPKATTTRRRQTRYARGYKSDLNPHLHWLRLNPGLPALLQFVIADVGATTDAEHAEEEGGENH